MRMKQAQAAQTRGSRSPKRRGRRVRAASALPRPESGFGRCFFCPLGKSAAIARKFRNEDAAGAADNDQAHTAAPVNEQADLASKGARKQRKLPCLVNAVDLGGRKTAVEQPVEGCELAWLEPLEIAFWFGNEKPRLSLWS